VKDRVESRGAHQPREVARCHAIGIDDHDAPDSQVDQLLNDVGTEPAGSDDADDETSEGSLPLPPEEAELAIEPLTAINGWRPKGPRSTRHVYV
jgi:hypothetical protein